MRALPRGDVPPVAYPAQLGVGREAGLRGRYC